MSNSTHSPKSSKRRLPVVSMAVLMAGLMLSVAVIGPTTQEAEAVIPIVVIGGALAVGAIIGWMANDIMKEGQNANAEAALEANKETLRASVKNTFSASMAFANTFTQDNIVNYEATQLLMTRQAEYQARELYLAQTQKGEPYIYDSDAVLSSIVIEQPEEILKACNEQYSAAFGTMSNVPDYFTGTLADMKLRLYNSAKQVERKVLPTSNYMVIPSINQGQVSLSGGVGHFYMTPNTEIIAISLTDGDKSIPLKQDGAVVHTYDMTGAVAGTMQKLTLPEHIAPGSFTVEPQTDIWLCGNVIPHINNDKAPMTESVIMYDNAGLATNLYVADNTGAHVRYWLGSGAPQSIPLDTSRFQLYIDNIELYAFRGDLITKQIFPVFKTMATTANVAANSYYNLLVESGDDQRYESMPDFLFPDPAQMEGLTVEEMYALLLVYRQQMAEYYQSGAYMDLGDAQFSPNSLGLYVRGALYNADGSPIYDNQTIWTPYVNVASQTLTVGQNVTFDNSMTVVKWGEADNIGAFLGVNASTANMRWSYPAAGAYCVIEEMFKDGEPVNEITLALSTYEALAPDIPDPLPPGNTNNTDDTESWLIKNWYWVTVGVGVVTIIAAALMRNGAIAGVGLLIVLVGLAGYAATEVLPEWWESVKPWIISQDFWRPGP